MQETHPRSRPAEPHPPFVPALVRGKTFCRPATKAARACGDRLAASVVVLSCALLTGCSGWQSALDPQGPHAQRLADLFWIFFGVGVVVWLLVMAALLVAVRRDRPERPDPLTTDTASERRIGSVIAGCVGATGAVVIALTILSYFAQQGLTATLGNALGITVAGHQWWWEVRYQDPEPGRIFVTANEIHIPVGQPIAVKLETRDVIHSFWIPSLAGKMDTINNHPNELQFTAARPGVYRGQCAEFCGQQHAKMAFFVVASPPDDFAKWRAQQLAPAETPRDPQRAAGLRVFLSRSCMACHTIRGTTAGGQVGPDLTHLASRRTLAAGSLPLTPGHLAAWIADPQHVKPGAEMPATPLNGAELNDLITYLMGLE